MLGSILQADSSATVASGKASRPGDGSSGPDRALHALAVDDGGSRACLAFTLLAARGIIRMVNAVKRAVIAFIAPQVEIIVYLAPRRQVLRPCRPRVVRAIPATYPCDRDGETQFLPLLGHCMVSLRKDVSAGKPCQECRHNQQLSLTPILNGALRR
jgi:hypothetical protein